MKKILALGLDWDGSLKSLLGVKEGNPELIKFIKNRLAQQHYDEVVVYIASNRQDKKRNDKPDLSWEVTGGCFSGIANFSEELKAACPTHSIRFDKLVLADIQEELQAGTSYNRAMSNTYVGKT